MAAAAPGRHARHPHALFPAPHQGAACTACTARKAWPHPGFAPPLLCQHALLQVCSLHISLTLMLSCISDNVWPSTHTALPICCGTHALCHLMLQHVLLCSILRSHQQQKVVVFGRILCILATYHAAGLSLNNTGGRNCVSCLMSASYQILACHETGYSTCCDNAELIVHSAGVRA